MECILLWIVVVVDIHTYSDILLDAVLVTKIQISEAHLYKSRLKLPKFH